MLGILSVSSEAVSLRQLPAGIAGAVGLSSQTVVPSRDLLPKPRAGASILFPS